MLIFCATLDIIKKDIHKLHGNLWHLISSIFMLSISVTLVCAPRVEVRFWLILTVLITLTVLHIVYPVIRAVIIRMSIITIIIIQCVIIAVAYCVLLLIIIINPLVITITHNVYTTYSIILFIITTICLIHRSSCRHRRSVLLMKVC